MSREWNYARSGPNSTKNVAFKSKKHSKESVDSSHIETRIIPPTDINFRTINSHNPIKHANQFDLRKKSTGGIPVIPINF